MRRVILALLLLISGCTKVKQDLVHTPENKAEEKFSAFSAREIQYDFSFYQGENYQKEGLNQYHFLEHGRLVNHHLFLTHGSSYQLQAQLKGIENLRIKIYRDEIVLVDENYKQSDEVRIDFVGQEDGEYSIEFEANEGRIDNITIKRFDEDVETIRINQLGYLNNYPKLFFAPFYVGDYYQVLDANDEVVYTGSFYHSGFHESAGEDIFEADFSTITKTGPYRIETEFGYRSPEFMIVDNYQQLQEESLKMIKAQRCGFELDEREFGLMAHPACHQDAAILHESLIYDYRIGLDVRGGWHDAGDFGRYTQTINKVLNDLILAYFAGNHDPKLVDEIRWGTDFLLRMQDESGGIYIKTVSEKFAPIIYPEDDHSQQYVLNKSTNVSGNAVMIFNLASLIIEDEVYQETLKQAAIRAYQYLSSNAYTEIVNPKDFNAGYYKEEYDYDERYNANASMYILTKDPVYLDKIEALLDAYPEYFKSGFNYDNTDGYGSFLLLHLEPNHRLYNRIYNQYMLQVNQLLEASKQNPYLISNLNLVWGSNYRLLDDSKAIYLAYLITQDETLKYYSLQNLDYVLGRNPLNQSYITGFGIRYPRNIHHRITMRNPQAQLNGALVGGVDAYLEDPVTQSVFDQNVPELKRYIDDSGSYSTNEVAVYYNSALYVLLSVLK